MDLDFEVNRQWSFSISRNGSTQIKNLIRTVITSLV